MKKIITLLLCLFVICGCSSEAKGGDLADIKKRGYITIAMEGNWQPYTYYDEDNKLVGYDVEVAKYIADYLGVEAKYEIGEWDGLLAGVSSGRYDMMVNGCDITDDRKQTYDFSDPYGYSKVVVMTTKDNEEIKSCEDLKGKTTANTITSTYALIAEEYGAEVTGVDDLQQTILLLEQGRIDATLNAETVYYDYVKVNPEANVKIACYTNEVYAIGIPMKKGSSDLVKAVNEALASAKADGTLTKLSNKYFGFDISE